VRLPGSRSAWLTTDPLGTKLAVPSRFVTGSAWWEAAMST